MTGLRRSPRRAALVAVLAACILAPIASPARADTTLDLLSDANVEIRGAAAFDFAGGAVAGAGDVNDDGRDDVIVGAGAAGNNARGGSGSAYVVYGQPELTVVELSSLFERGFRIDGAEFGDQAGAAVGGAGDVNDDGIDDVIVGAPLEDSRGRFDAGAAYVVYGKRGARANIDFRTLGANGFRIDGLPKNSTAGSSVAGAGDVNDDGIDDVILSVPFVPVGTSRLISSSFVVYGRADGPPDVDLSTLGAGGFRIDGVRNGGRSVDGAGDVNRDGIDDVVVGDGDYRENRPTAGSASVVYGVNGARADVDLTALGTAGFRIDGAATSDGVGISVAGAGDVNRDGREDVVVGASGAGNRGRVASGSAYVIYGDGGTAANVDLAALGARGFRIDGATADDRAGGAVAGAGDLNGDGRAEVIVGADTANANGPFTGSAYVVYGRSGDPAGIDLGALGDRGVRIDGAAADDRAGGAVAGAGDFNGDGRDEVLVGSGYVNSNGRTRSGAAYLVGGPVCTDTDDNGNSDNDGDGLCDNWETEGIDSDGDGSVDLRLHDINGDGDIRLGEQADPNHKDLYVEIDYMELHRPNADGLNDVVAAFRDAPVDNPDGEPGVRLHIQVDERAAAHNDNLAAFGQGAPPGTPDLDTIKEGRFGTEDERTAGETVLDAKRFAFRYGFFAHNLAGLGTVSGRAELPGNDLVVSLGSWTPVGGHDVGTADQQAGTLMHELGHTLNLRHGGTDDVNCKPNYLSVMSYLRVFDYGPIPDRPLDYSRAALPALDESNLDEVVGIGGPLGGRTAHGPVLATLAPSAGPIDWDRDGDAVDTGVKFDLNNLQNTGCDGEGAVLQGADDWFRLQYDFRKAADFANGVHTSVAEVEEVTYEQARALSSDGDGDGVDDFEDNCREVSNPGQADGDADEQGDACDGAAPSPGPGPDPSPSPGVPPGPDPPRPGPAVPPGPDPPAAPPAPPGPAPAGAAGDRTPPRIAAFSLTAPVFRVRPAGARARQGAGPPVGAGFRYRLSEPARVTITLRRAAGGPRAGTLVRRAGAGPTTQRFTGRLGRRALAPGPYTATIVATDAAGNRSRPRRVVFLVAP